MMRALGYIANWLESQSPENLESQIPRLPVRFAEETGLSEKEIILLEEMIKLFDEKSNYKHFVMQLRGAIHVWTNPDRETFIPSKQNHKSLFLFDEFIPVKDIAKLILKLVKNRNRAKSSPKIRPKYRTIIRDVINKQGEEKKNFSIEPKDLQKVQRRLTKRAKTKSTFNNKDGSSPGKGRIIRCSQEKSGNIAISPTVFNAIKQGNYSLERKKFDIKTNDFLYPQYERNVIYNMMLVLDTSKSITWMIDNIEGIISHITTNAFHSRDKLGLITFQNDRALIHHYPTLNVKQIIGTINKIETKGKTPLGEGLNLALQVFTKEQYNMPGMKNIIIMISDCFPEPLEGCHKNLLEEPCYKAVISASERIRKAKIDLVIINPSTQDSTESWNYKLINKVIDVSQAKYIRIHPRIRYNSPKETETFISKADSLYLTETIWKVKTGLE